MRFQDVLARFAQLGAVRLQATEIAVTAFLGLDLAAQPAGVAPARGVSLFGAALRGVDGFCCASRNSWRGRYEQRNGNRERGRRKDSFAEHSS
jgi:hypothetical protein